MQGTRGTLLSLCGLVIKSCLILATPWTVACQVPLSMGFSKKEYWSGLPFPSYPFMTLPKLWFSHLYSLVSPGTLWLRVNHLVSDFGGQFLR